MRSICVIIILSLLIAPLQVRAAVCEAGYYLSADNECVQCNPTWSPYYCPGDDIQYKCPKTNTDYTQFGYGFIGGAEGTWATGPTASSTSSCYCSMDFIDQYGNIFLLENTFNGENYWGHRKLWYYAAPGYYLSPYSWSSSHNWYSGVKACTNAPEHAHYTGAGTPDAPDGSITDANDCPWECDDGYGRHNDACVPLCATGITKINTSEISFNIYPNAYTTPALHIKYNNQICYVSLTPGRGDKTINIEYNGQIFHTAN